ncbi:DUF4274 domain-containing protein [Marivita sp. S0852]|uniref:DUF4274 domain-containing protein n=1 Tax=Marivita sp. S0852 TaxID=3373893 RepID=UPI003981BC03
MKELARLVQHIRPGARASDVDALSALSDGLLTAERLTDGLKWASDQMPCRIELSAPSTDPRTVTSVVFPARHCDPEGIADLGSPEALLAAVPGATRAYVSYYQKKMESELIDLPASASGIVARIRFNRGHFNQTEYREASQFAAMDQREKKREEPYLERYREEEEKELAYKRLTLQEKLAPLRAEQARKLAELGAHGVLREWAQDYSGWGESSNRWLSFVDWLITESTPDDRHGFACNWNWDHGIDVHRWIIRQPDTDIATVATTIWNMLPSDHIPEIAKGREGYTNGIGLAHCEMLLEIAERIRAGFYQPREGFAPIGFNPPSRLKFKEETDAIRHATDLLLPPVVREPIAGRGGAELNQRCPAVFFEILN